MKKIIATSLISMAMATSAAAQTADDTVTINASVEKECLIEDIAAIDLGALPVVETAGPDALLLAAGETRSTTSAWVSCNFTNRMTVGAPAPLTSASAAPLLGDEEPGSATFANEINYRFRAHNYSTGPEANTFGTPTSGRQSAQIHKQIAFWARVFGEDNVGVRPIAADDYTATATVEITTL